MAALPEALAEVRELLLAPDLVRATAGGQRRGGTPSLVSATLRPVTLKAGQRVQLVTEDGQRPTTVNLAPGAELASRVDELLDEPFGSWVVETGRGTLRLQATKKGAVLHRSAGAAPAADTGHDRAKEHLIDPGDPLYAVIGGDAAKRRQVDAFLRALDATLPDPAQLPSPLHVVDLGCGNAYLTFAAYRYLSGRGVDVRLIGVDVRADQRERNTALAERLGWAEHVTFVAGTIADAPVPAADVVLALHACDTATDDALARALAWDAQWILAAPCCHKDLSRQLRRQPPTGPAGLLTAYGILRERFADVLTDTVRAALLREHGYAVEVVEFIDSAHTPRNAMIRARRTGRTPAAEERAELAALLAEWRITPHLATLLPS
ncbi:methyltransferase [Catellatospora sp. IY07-71]|uniref:class I SAM-dependent methyltransferase n=1 Tax=Catellatospora sp. IY07-71 TaxID=2728827 RepID=UPI001BB35784|nr:SAM-dependent methyltransferase [Catellatospora sp. IY07-71]BCJ71269.1 methyltransferase [Catellatospora sp. IY07-71]